MEVGKEEEEEKKKKKKIPKPTHSRAEQPFLSLALPHRLQMITAGSIPSHPSDHQHRHERCIAAAAGKAAAAAAAAARASRCRRAAAAERAEPLVTSFIQNQKQIEAFSAGLRAQRLPALRLLLMH